MYEVKKLYRKDNKRARNYAGNKGGDYCHSRNSMKEFEGTYSSMHGNKQRGMDYTPLYKFLLSKIGERWDDVYSEVISRLDKKEPIFRMVELHPDADTLGVKCMGESTYYSLLTVDENGILVKYWPSLTANMMYTQCNCCTHTFNGEVYKTDISFNEFYRDIERYK